MPEDSPIIKVAHVTTVDISLRYLLLNQMQSIQEAGYEICGVSAVGPDVRIIEQGGIRHIAVPFTRASNLTPVDDLKAFVHLVRLFRREKFTIVHTHTAKPDLYATIAARLAGTPIVLTTLHGFFFHDNMARHWRRLFIILARIGGWFADVILSQNPEDLETNRREKVYRPDKMKQLGNGIDISRFNRDRLDKRVLAQTRAELDIPPGVPVVGFVGRLVRDKGVLELLEAAKTIHQQMPDARFLLVGMIDWAKEDAITPEIAKAYGLEEVCVFTGQREDMPELYALMDVFVLPSHREAFPRSVMEASAMQVPCVVTDVRGCRTAVENGRNGLLVPLGDVPALAEAILQLLQNPAERERMGCEGRLMAQERFDEQLVFDIVKAEYARLLQEKGLPVPAPTKIGH